jgi:hypothetical protein
MGFKTSILLFFLFITPWAIAQGQGSIKASVDKNRILIGEPLQLIIDAEVKVTSKLFKIDTIPHFELLKAPKIDSTSNDGITKVRIIMELTSFDSGHWVIPSFAISSRIKTDTIPIDVVFSEFDPNKDYNDIKDILEVDIKEKQFPWWWYAAGGVLLIAVVVYLVKRKKPVVKPVAPKMAVDAYEEAMRDLEELQRNKPGAKIYYTRLTDIFRLYLFRKKGILSLQKTTDDLLIQLKSLDLPKEQFEKLSQSLRLGDFVKFAKYVPATEDDRNVLEDIRQAIKTIEKPVATS